LAFLHLIQHNRTLAKRTFYCVSLFLYTSIWKRTMVL